MAKWKPTAGPRGRLAQSVRRLPLGVKLGVPLTAVSVMTALALGVTLGMGASKAIKADSTDHARRLAGYIGSYVASNQSREPGSTGQNQLATQMFVRGLMAINPSLVNIRIFRRLPDNLSPYVNSGAKGDSVPSAHDLQLANTGTAVSYPSASDGVPTLEYLNPLRVDGRVWGVVEIEYSSVAQTAAITAIWIDTALVTGLGLAVELALFWLLLRTLILQRLRHIREVASQVSNLDLNPEPLQPYAVAGRDELAIVGRQVDEMLRGIRRRAGQDRVLFDLSLEAARATDLDIVMSNAGVAVGQLIHNVELVTYELIGEQSDLSVRRYSSADPDASGQPPSKLSDLTVLPYIVASGEDVFYQEGVPEDRFDPALLAARRIRSGIGVPIPGRSKPFGMLAAFSSDAKAFEAGDLGFIKSLAGLIGVTTARLRADSERAASETRLHATFATSPAGIIFVDHLNGNILDANPALCETLGYEAIELRAMNVIDIVAPDDLEWAANQMAAATSTTPDSGGAFPKGTRFEQRYIARDGHVVWMQLSASLVLDSAGAPRYFQSTCIDVTERKAAEATLKSTLSLLRKTGEDRQRLMISLMQAQQEQAKAASHLHDHVTQVLVGSALELEALATGLAAPDSAQRIEITRAAVDGAVAELRDATDRRRARRRESGEVKEKVPA